MKHVNPDTQIGLGGQCGGINYNGSTTCVTGLTCFVRDFQYSMCDLNCQVGWLCSTSKSTTTSIRTTLITSEKSSGEQCGGKGFNGSKYCVSGLTCFVKNYTFSACLIICPIEWQCSVKLINYWPMSNLSDVVGGANLFGGLNYSFVSDRFGSPNSAIYFNKGYLQVPEGVYFSGDFTFTAWIFLKSYQSWSRIFEFGNGDGNDNVALAMNGASSKISGLMFNGSFGSYIHTSSIINLNKWYFISFVLNGTTGYIYVNGSQVINGTLNVPNNIIRTRNYIGKSNWATDLNADAIYDEFKIYKVALSSNEISNEYQSSSVNGK